MRRLIIAGMIAALASTTYATAFAVSPTARHAAPAGVSHVGPDKVAWYDASRATAAAPPAPMPGVGPKDLVVAGITLNTALLPVTLPIPPVRQVADFVALSFKVPVDTSPASLTLQLTGTTTTAIDKHLPSGVTPMACPATSSFKSGLQQPANAAPKYDCSKRAVVGQLGASGKTVTFPGISRLLLSGDTLSVVILPGSLGPERLVFSPPTDMTLSLLSFGTPTPTRLTGPVVPPQLVPTPPSVPGATGSVPPIPPVPAATVAAPAASQPVIAPTTPGLAQAALSKPNDHRERAAALAMLVALAVAAGWLTVTDRGGKRPRTDELGVGRFRSTRTGLPPAI
ncbi:MAG: hypothetical protein ACTHK4_02125 [Mycobacteriales bacterium]